MEPTPPLSDEDALLLELMLQTEVFCNEIEAAAKPAAGILEIETLMLKISQCRGALSCLQEAYENDDFGVEKPYVCAMFRTALTALLWTTFHTRHIMTQSRFRKIVQIESGFTYLLITRRSKSRQE